MRSVFVVLLFACGGCVHTTTIRPDQLTHGAGVVLTPDGRTAEIGSSYDARLVLRDATSLSFSSPVVVTEEPTGTLHVAGHNREETAVSLGDIQRVEIVEPDFWATFALGTTLAVIGTVALFCIGATIWAAAQPTRDYELGAPMISP